MKYGRLIDANGQVLVPRLAATTGSFERMRGLLGRAALKSGDGMLIKPCNAVHTLGMRYPIDAVFLGRDGVVLRIVSALKPARATGCMRARCVLELAAGEAERLGLCENSNLKADFEVAA